MRIKEEMQVNGDEESLMDFIAKLGTKYMKLTVKTEKDLERFASAAFFENIAYLELRACPLPIIQTIPTITIENYIKAVRKGMLAAESNYNIKTSLIISIKREDTLEDNLKLANETVSAHKNKLIQGVDLCGNESSYPTRNYTELFKIFRNANIPITIHAGEADTSESIKDAISLGANRIGHATNLYKDRELMKEIKNKKIGIECCITSNLHTKAISSIEEHPIRHYVENDLLTSFNTDDPITSCITEDSEYELLKNRFSFSENTIKKLVSNALDMSFLNWKDKIMLKNKLKL